MGAGDGWKEDIVTRLTAKDDKYACALADKIVSESQETDEWYKYFDDFASLLNHPKSLVKSAPLRFAGDKNHMRKPLPMAASVRAFCCLSILTLAGGKAGEQGPAGDGCRL